MTDERAFRVGFVPGVTLTKWSRVWEERRPETPLEIFHVDASDPTATLRQGEADVVFARLPLGDGDDFHSISLYDEQPVAVLPKGHALADSASLLLADLGDEKRFDLDPSLALTTVVEVVETGAGVAVMPQSLARLYGRKGVVARPVTDLPATTIALVWTAGATTDDVNDFIGVVRGRTANSSRGATPDADDAVDKPLGPVAKAKLKRQAAAAAAPTPKGKSRSPQRGKGRGGPQRGRR